MTQPKSYGWGSTRSTWPIAVCSGSTPCRLPSALVGSIRSPNGSTTMPGASDGRAGGPAVSGARSMLHMLSVLKPRALMQPSGLAAFERRKPDRTGIYAFEHADLALEPAQELALRSDNAAWAFWSTATPSYRKLVTAWIISAKREATRASRLQQLIDDSANGRLVPPQRYGETPRWVTRAAAAAGAVSPVGGNEGQDTP